MKRLALVLLILVVLLTACASSPASPTVTPAPTKVAASINPSPIPTLAPTVAPTSTPAILAVGNTGGDGVYIRKSPSAADKLKVWADDTPMIVIGQDEQAEGKTWKKVCDPEGNEGWIPAEYLVVATARPTATVTVRVMPVTATVAPPVVPVILPTKPPVQRPCAGASALCKDGTCSYSKTRSGTCSHHGGVAIWNP